MIKLVAFDLDDTLINDALQISRENLTAVTRVMNLGVAVTIATGRMHISALPFAKQLGLPEDQIVISYNGALLKRLNGELIRHWPVEKETVAAVIRHCQALGRTLNIYHKDQLYVAEINSDVESYMKQVGVKAHPVGDLYKFVVEGNLSVSKMLIAGSESQTQMDLPRIQTAFGSQAQVTRSKPKYIEITDLSITKGRALAFMAAKMNLSPQQVMAIGDGGNDLDMIKWAGLGIAVANASPDVQAAADFVTLSNEESGVAFALDKFI